jgi:hypothetical protein
VSPVIVILIRMLQLFDDYRWTKPQMISPFLIKRGRAGDLCAARNEYKSFFYLYYYYSKDNRCSKSLITLEYRTQGKKGYQMVVLFHVYF